MQGIQFRSSAPGSTPIGTVNVYVFVSPGFTILLVSEITVFILKNLILDGN